MKTQKNWGKYLLLITVISIISTFNILHVIIGYGKTPVNGFYMATGHYYLDYFEYVTEIAQGMRGDWLASSPVSTENQAVYFQSFPYILIGKIAKLFFLSPITAYWFSVFFLTMAEFLLIYFIISKTVPKLNFISRVSALLLIAFATSYFSIKRIIGGLMIDPVDFWYSPSNIYRRIGAVPYHFLSTLIILLTLIITAITLQKISEGRKSNSWSWGIIAGTFIVFVLTFSPFNILTLLTTIFLTSFFYGLYFLIKKKKMELIQLFLFLIPIGILVLPSALFIKQLYGTTFKNLQAIETQWIQYYPLTTILLNIGPILLFVPFGIINFLKKPNPFKILLLVFAVISYGFFLSPLASYLGTHNLRFLSEINYILFGVIAVLGIWTVGRFFFGRFKEIFFIVIVLLTLGYFSLGNWFFLNNQLKDFNLFSPITYLPKGVVEGFKHLNQVNDDRVVLTSPAQFLGVVLPIFSDKLVYIARPGGNDYPFKANQADKFYLGKMSEEEALAFVKYNRIGYVILTSIEGYSVKDLEKYSFLKSAYKNKDIIIFKTDIQ